MRLTKKLKPPYERVAGEDYIYTSETRLTLSFAKVEQKLGQLEDIEEELGIELVTLFKAVSNPFYTRKGTYHYVGFDSIEQDSKGDWYFSTVDGDYYFKDYGKTWALTKEELL